LSSSTPTHTFANTNRNSKNITYIDCENNNNNLIYDSDKEALFVNNDDDVDNNSKRTVSSAYENNNEKKAEMLFKRYLKLYENIGKMALIFHILFLVPGSFASEIVSVNRIQKGKF